jgi:hypothetical protein
VADVNLRLVLKHSAYVQRAQTAIGAGLDPLSTQYVAGEGPVPALVQPLRGDLLATVAGRLPDATHVVYLEGGVQLAPGDVLVVEAGAVERRFEALDVEDEGGQGHHLRVVVKERE